MLVGSVSISRLSLLYVSFSRAFLCIHDADLVGKYSSSFLVVRITVFMMLVTSIGKYSLSFLVIRITVFMMLVGSVSTRRLSLSRVFLCIHDADQVVLVVFPCYTYYCIHDAELVSKYSSSFLVIHITVFMMLVRSVGKFVVFPYYTHYFSRASHCIHDADLDGKYSSSLYVYYCIHDARQVDKFFVFPYYMHYFLRASHCIHDDGRVSSEFDELAAGSLPRVHGNFS
ncbi:hypothetical protein SDJN03_14456, partial [Cucurbita argyrosperma subsp. sororia]